MTKADCNPLTLYSKTIGTGPDLVILHGLFGDHQNWSTQARTLSEKFTVHSLDLRNHGRSPHDDQMDYAAMAADVAFTCDQLHIDSTRLIGHSMGGKVAMQLCQTQPERVDQLVVVDIAPRQYPPHHSDVLTGLRALADDPPTSRGQADASLARHVADAGVRAFLLKNLQRNGNGFELRINLDTIERHYSRIAAAVDAGNAYTGPTLFIKGELSDYLKADDRDAIIARFPKSRLKVIGGAGHWPHAEKPAIVSKILMDFLTP